jgi:hypothetical protein
MEKQALFWNPPHRGQCRRGRLRRSRRTIDEETEIVHNTWREFKAAAGNRLHWRCFIEAYAAKWSNRRLTELLYIHHCVFF